MMVLTDTAKSLWSSNPIPRGCVLYAPLGAGGLRGDIFRSVDYYRHTITNSGSTHKLGEGRSFDGDDKIAFGQGSALINHTASTFLVWFKAGSFTGAIRYIWYGGYWASPFGDYIRLNAPSDQYTVNVRNTDGTAVALASSGRSFTADVWNLVGYSWDGTTAIPYLNGVAETAGSAFSGTQACSGAVDNELGNYDATLYYDSLVGAVLKYNRGLSAAEIAYIYRMTQGR